MEISIIGAGRMTIPINKIEPQKSYSYNNYNYNNHYTPPVPAAEKAPNAFEPSPYANGSLIRIPLYQ